MRRPSVRTRIPGPKAKAIIEQSAAHRSLPDTPTRPLVMETASGCWIVDPDGNELLDMTSGRGVAPLGHGHESIVEAISTQAAALVHHAPSQAYDAAQVELCERLCSMGAVRGKDQRVYLAGSGSEAMRAAVELARRHSERDSIIAFVDSLDGPDLSAVPVATSKVIERSGLKSLVSGVFHARYPDPMRQGDEALAEALEGLGTILGKLVSPSNVAALLIEPVQHDGGYVVPPEQFLVALRRLCDQHGLLLIVNEIHTALGRTGKMFGWQHSKMEPDIVCVAGGLAAGLPLGATIARKELMVWPPTTRSSTFGGNPVACKAALQTLDLIEDGLVERAVTVGEQLLEKLRDAVGEHPRIGEVRGLGLMLAAELVKNREDLEHDPEARDDVVDECFQRGLMLVRCGQSAVGWAPPLTVSDEEIDVAVEIFAEVLADID